MLKKKPRIEDVARLAGLSTTTVSRVINKVPTVKKSNRIKVEAVIRKLKFRPNVSAQRLAGGKKGAIGLAIPRYEGIFYSFFGIEIIRGIGVTCDAQRLDLLLHIANGTSSINLGSIDGIIFADILGNMSRLKQALKEDIPCIVINKFIDDIDVSCISINNKTGAKQAVDYLVNLGHRRIAHITGDLKTQAANQRLEGFRESLRNHDLRSFPEYIKTADFSRALGRTATLELLGLAHRPTAIFAASDDMAMEAIEVVIERGLKVPADISVVGFDNNPAGSGAAVALTTIKQPLIEMCQLAVKELTQEINSKTKGKSTRLILPTELIIRESAAPPKVS